MMKKPFGNITKLKKDKPAQQQQPIITQKQKQPLSQPQTFIQRPPTGKLKLDINKGKGSIYDAVRKVDQQKQQGIGSVHKPTLTFKKNKLLTKGEKNQAPQNPRMRQNQQLQQSTENTFNLPKPTPIFNRNKGRLMAGKSKQKPIIASQQIQQPKMSQQNRMAYVNQQQQQQPQPTMQQQQPSKKLIKPNLFKGVGEKKRPQQQVPPAGYSSRQSHQQVLNTSQVYQQYNSGVEKKEKFNFQKMMNVQRQQINLERIQHHQVSLDKLQKQSRRAKELSQLLNLQIDLYEPIMSLSSTTPFQVYISKIKSGFLKNSSDEAFDQKNDVQSQTLSYEYIDFMNQCPQDYQLGSGNFHSLHLEQQATHSIDQMILHIAPVIQQLIKPSKNVTMPPTSLLAFSPSFKKFLKCPNPTFVYYSQMYNYSLWVSGEKLYICEDEIQCALDLGGSKIAGLKNGRIVLWNGENNRGSSTYNILKEIIQSQNFELPVYVTNDFDKLSPYLCEGAIVSLLANEQKNTFHSLDSFGRLVKWHVQKQNKRTLLIPKQLQQFSKIIQKRHLIGYNIKRRNEITYIHTSSGIICWDGHQVQQRLQAFAVKDFYLPKRSSLVYCLTQMSTILIFDTSYHFALSQIKLNLNDGEIIEELIIPELEHDNREIALFYYACVVTDSGMIYQLNLTQSQPQLKPLSALTSRQSKQQHGSSSKRQSNVIYNGVNLVGNKIEKIKLYKDLKCTTEMLSIGVDLESSVNNLKSIILKNKEFLAALMEKNVCLV